MGKIRFTYGVYIKDKINMMKFTRLLLVFLSLLIVSCSQDLSTEEYLQSGQKMLSENKWKGAIIEFKNAVKQSPENAKARALLGETYLNTYSSNAAIKELKKALELGSKDNSVLLHLGKAYQQKNENQSILTEIQANDSQDSSIQANIHALRADALLKLNKIDEAKKELDQAKKLDSNNADVRLAWASYENRNKDADAQIKWLKPLLDNGKGNAEAWSQMAEIEQQSSNLVAAEKAYTKAISIRGFVHLDTLKRALVRIGQKNYIGATEDINNLKKAGAQWPMVGYTEALIAYNQKNYDSAQSILENVLSKYADYLPARLLLGLTYFDKGNYQNAATNLELYLSSIPDALQAKFIYSASLLKLGKASEAIPVLLSLNKIYPENFKVLTLLGNAYLIDKQQDRSIEFLTKAVNLQPEQARTRVQLASVLMSEPSGLEDAQQQLLKAIELDPELFQADYALFLNYMRSKKYSEARKVASKLKEKEKENSLGSNLVAMSYLAEGHKGKAISELKAALTLFPADPTTSNTLARIFLQDNEFAKAKALYLKVLEKKPDDIKSMNQLALIAAKQNEPKQIIDWLKKAVEKNPDVLSAKLQLATQYLRTNEPNQAVQLLQNVRNEDKQNPNYILLMANAKIGVGEYQHAVRALKSLISDKPELSSAHFLLAQAYAHQSDKNNMKESLEKAIKYNPAHLTANVMLARLDLMDKNIDDFKKRVAMLMESYPDNKDVQFLNAKIQSSEKGYDSAIKTLKGLLSETPHSEVVMDLAKNQWLTGDKNGAISGLELWLQDNKDDKNALMLIAQYYLAENRTSDAKKAYQSLGDLVPDNPVVLNNLAWLMMGTDVDQGIVYAKKALDLVPEDPFIEDTLAMLFLKKGDQKNALIHSKIAATKKPNLVDIQLNYAKVLNANNQKEQAKALLNKLLNNVKDYDKRQAISKELNNI